MVQDYCAGVSGISQAQEVYRQTMSGVDMVLDSFGSYDKIRVLISNGYENTNLDLL